MPKSTQAKTGKKAMDSKKIAKADLQKEIGWPAEPKRPMICLPTGMTEELGGALLNEVLPGLLTLQTEILVLGKGSESFGSMFTELSARNGHRIYIIPNEPEAIEKMYAASDIALFLAEPTHMPEMKHCLAYGVVPIAPTTDILSDYNAIQESGNAFLYEELNPWHCFAALVRAIETYKFPYDWKTIQKHCLET